MDLNSDTSLYDILDLKPDASPQEVREAYLRTKAAYNKDSVALYTLISSEEREETLHKIEEAYDVLSSADRRKDYDRNHGLLEFDEADSPSRVPHNKKIISIDRVPPMESSQNSESLLVAPTTDFTAARAAPEPQPSAGGTSTLTMLQGGSSGEDELFGGPAAADGGATPSAPAATEAPASSNPSPGPLAAVAEIAGLTSVPSPGASERKVHPRTNESSLAQEISQEIEWKGHFMRKVREARRISIEEMSNITKVSKTYIVAIEEENFPKLPAPVFMRGFVTQMAKVLKLPHDQVASAYMARYYQARPDKTAK
jgi:curved DNA-binding protein CbpA